MSVIEMSPAERHRRHAMVDPPRGVIAAEPPPERLVVDPVLRIAQVAEATGLSRSAIYRRMDAGEFPRPLDLGANTIGWRASTINRWLDERPER